MSFQFVVLNVLDVGIKSKSKSSTQKVISKSFPLNSYHIFTIDNRTHECISVMYYMYGAFGQPLCVYVTDVTHYNKKYQ